MSNYNPTWPSVPLLELCNPKQWPTIPQTAFTSSGYPVYGANGKIGYYTEFNHEKPTVLITCRGATCGTINVCEPKSYVTGNSMALDDLDESRVCSEYLVHALRNGRLAKAISGTAQPQITRQGLSAISIPLPPLPEQRRIAEILDKADALRTKRRAALAQLHFLTNSIFLDLFNDSKLADRTIGDLLESGALLLHKDGNHGSLYPNADDFGNAGVPFLSAKAITDDGLIDNTLIENLREDKADKLRIGWISKGDVLLAHNASVGKVALYDGRFDRALIGTSLTAFRPNPELINSHYLAAALRSSRFQRQLEKNMGQTTRNQVPITAQRELRLILPPLSAQQEFASRVEAVEKLKTAQRAMLADLDSLFVSLQHRAFRGDL
jgi:type I restriction enzyme, S subunit